MPYFSIIVPVYNRPEEVRGLLESLAAQSCKDFELVLVEDGSEIPCEQVAEIYDGKIDIKYYYKNNEGRSAARNYGLERATGEYFVFFDSDCVIPPDYFKSLKEALGKEFTPCFGGPDAASEDFTDLQKAISFSMTSFLTTGGIRGGKVQMEKFVPRSFNMGFAREVWEKVGGFREMLAEDLDLSIRIRKAGFASRLIREVFVYHKRRVSIRRYAKQMYMFGTGRVGLKQIYPESLKAVHCLPALFLLGCIFLIICSFWRWWAILPIVVYALSLWLSALASTKSLKIACLSVVTSFIQLFCYGYGFIRAYIWEILLGHGRNVKNELKMRRES
jgi:glycosyltransferase involved in cell wall biosynthesis